MVSVNDVEVVSKSMFNMWLGVFWCVCVGGWELGMKKRQREKFMFVCEGGTLYFWHSQHAATLSVQTKKHFPSPSQFNSCVHGWH